MRILKGHVEQYRQDEVEDYAVWQVHAAVASLFCHSYCQNRTLVVGCLIFASTYMVPVQGIHTSLE